MPEQVLIAYNMKSLSFGRDYIIPKPFDGRLITAVAPAVARAAMESGVARHPITDWDKYVESLEERLNKQPKIVRLLQTRAATAPKRVVFAEANYLNVLRAAYIAREEGTAVPILLGDEKQIRELMAANQLEMDVEIINTRGEAAHPTVSRYARRYWEEHQRMGVSLYDAERLMERRDYFAAMMLHEGLADAMIAGYDKSHISRQGFGQSVVQAAPRGQSRPGNHRAGAARAQESGTPGLCRSFDRRHPPHGLCGSGRRTASRGEDRFAVGRGRNGSQGLGKRLFMAGMREKDLGWPGSAGIKS